MSGTVALRIFWSPVSSFSITEILPGSGDAAVGISIGESSSLLRLVTILKGPWACELAADLLTGTGAATSVPVEDVVPLVPMVGVDPDLERGFNACNKEPILDILPR